MDQWFWSRRFLKSFQCIFTISQLSPLWERCGPSFEQTWIAFTQGCSVPDLIENSQVVMQKKIFLKVCQSIFIISQLSPVWEGRGPLFKILNSLNPLWYFVPSLVEIDPVVLEKKTKMWKVYGRTDRQTADGRQVIRKAHLSFQLIILHSRKSRSNVRQWLTAMLIGFKHISPSQCLSTLCHEKSFLDICNLSICLSCTLKVSIVFFAVFFE